MENRGVACVEECGFALTRPRSQHAIERDEQNPRTSRHHETETREGEGDDEANLVG